MTEDSDRARNLLVTGCYRSGTTMVEKLLHARPGVTVASQPMPALYHVAKQCFIDARGLRRRYPLDHGFLETDYRNEDFARFLAEAHLGPSTLAQVFEQLERFGEGHWTPELRRMQDRFEPGTFSDQLDTLHRCIAELLPEDEPRWVGSKEILCEEYIPFLRDRGTAVVLVVRDPRDVVASVNFGDRYAQMGAPRPILYSLRVWRKSVAYALSRSADADVHVVRYEELVGDPDAVLGRVLRGLGLPGLERTVSDAPLLDQDGRPWSGNSSFDDATGVSTASVGRFRDRLPEDVWRYVETVCLPEMLALGYAPERVETFDPAVLSGYRPSFSGMHAKFAADYGYRPDHVEQEWSRFRRLRGEQPHRDDESRAWFLCDGVFETLSAALAGAPSGGA